MQPAMAVMVKEASKAKRRRKEWRNPYRVVCLSRLS